ncbi:unnamed protein product [Malus baccata var. baccata]
MVPGSNSHIQDLQGLRANAIRRLKMKLGNGQVNIFHRTGNNNYLETLFKGNHYPHGKDFPGQIPTGRFSSGKLTPTFRITTSSPASTGSGYEDITAAGAGIIAFSKQIELSKKYVVRVEGFEGKRRQRMLPPIGCLPYKNEQPQINKALRFTKVEVNVYHTHLYLAFPYKRVDDENSDSQIYNQKLAKLLPKSSHCFQGSRITLILWTWISPVGHGNVLTRTHPSSNHISRFLETKRGCCGTGFVEAAYQYLSKYLEKNVLPKLAYHNQSQPLITRSDHPYRADDRYW